MSHAGADVAATELVYRWLADDDHEVFLDRHPHSGIAPGDEWTKRLHERLRWADAVVCVVTSAYTRGRTGARPRSPWPGPGVPWCCRSGPRRSVRHPLLADLQEIDATRDPQDAHRRLTGRLVSLYGAPLAVPDDLEPFPGLLPFDADRHRIFFGQEADVQRLADALRSPAERADAALFVLVGPSGCGKSSLVRAGLLPTVAREPDQFSLTPIVPGQDPAGAVFRELAEAGTRTLRLPGWSIEHVRQRVAANGLSRVLDELLLAVPGPRRTRVILVVDQFELLTRTSARPRVRIRRAGRSGPGRVPAGGHHLAPGVPRPAARLRGVGRPAEARPHPGADEPGRAPVGDREAGEVAGIALDDGLADQLVADTGSGEALPLLACTLAQLAEGVKRGGRLTLARYDQLGRVTGALVRQADEALAEAVRAGGRDRAAVIRSLMRLVHVDEPAAGGRPRAARRAAAGGPRRAGPVPQAAAAHHGHGGDRRRRRRERPAGGRGGGPRGSPDRLAPADRRGPAGPGGLPRAAPAGAGRPALGGCRPRRHLWSGSQLTTAAADVGARLRWATLTTERTELDSESARFLRASMLRVRRARRALSAVLVVLTLVMTVSGGVALWQRQLAAEQRQIAVARQLLSDADVARESDVRQALMLGVAARAS